MPSSLVVKGYHGGTSDSGYGYSEVTLTAPSSGTLTIKVTYDNRTDGYTNFDVNSSGVLNGEGTATVSITKGQKYVLGFSADGLGSWGRLEATASLTWNI